MDRFRLGDIGKQSQGKYYSITKNGRKQLASDTEYWERIAVVIGRLVKLEGRQ